mgnify:CR=1 FL=1
MFDISGAGLFDDMVALALRLLCKFSKSLSYLDLSRNEIGPKSVEALKELIPALPLQYFIASGCGINNNNFANICLGLSNNTTLREVDFSKNQIGKYFSNNWL